MRWGMHDPGFLCTFFTRAIMSAKSRGINWSFHQSPLKIEKLKPYIVSAWQPRNGYNCEQCICEWVCVCEWLFVWPVCVTDMVSNIPTVHADAKKPRQSSIWSQPPSTILSCREANLLGLLGDLGASHRSHAPKRNFTHYAQELLRQIQKTTGKTMQVGKDTL